MKNKKELATSIFYLLDGSQSENERKRKNEQIFGLYQRILKNCRTVTSIVVGAHETVPRNLEKRLEELETRERIETIKTTVLLRWVRILRRVLETTGDSSERQRANTCVKIFTRSKIIIF